MFKINIGIETIRFEFQAYSKTVRLVMQRRMRVAARAFVRAAIKNVPVQSGMARGSFLNIGRLLRRISIPISPTVTGTFYYRNGVKIAKNPEAGALLSTPEEEVLTDTGDIYYFNYGTDVFHYNINEFFGGHAPTAPWLSYAAGHAAFIADMNEKLVRHLPSIKQFLIVDKIEVNGTTITKSSRRYTQETTPLEE